MLVYKGMWLGTSHQQHWKQLLLPSPVLGDQAIYRQTDPRRSGQRASSTLQYHTTVLTGSPRLVNQPSASLQAKTPRQRRNVQEVLNSMVFQCREMKTLLLLPCPMPQVLMISSARIPRITGNPWVLIPGLWSKGEGVPIAQLWYERIYLKRGKSSWFLVLLFIGWVASGNLGNLSEL